MDKENNISANTPDDNWLDEILGSSTPKANATPDELLSNMLADTRDAEAEIDPEALKLENILAENWQSQPDPEVIPAQEESPAVWEDPQIELSLQDTVWDDPDIAASIDLSAWESPEMDVVSDQPFWTDNVTVIPEPMPQEATTQIPQVSQETVQIPVTQETMQVPVIQETMQVPVIQEAEQIPVTQETIQVPLTQETIQVPVTQETIQVPVQEPTSQEAAANPEAPSQDPLPQEEEPLTEDKKETKKSRPKNKHGFSIRDIPPIISTLILGMLVVIMGVSLGHTAWIMCSDVMGFGKTDKEISVTITSKDSIDDISEKLANAGLIQQPKLFKLFATLTGKDEDISTGTFTLNRYYDYNAMINAMGYYAPAREEVTVMIPEGYTCAQIFALLEENGVCAVSDLESYASTGELDEYWFLEDVPRGSKYCLEGYLFPDTYDFYTQDDPRRVLEKFLNNFNYRFKDKMIEDFALLQEKYGEDLTIRDLVILASMVERETANNAESFAIAAVYYNRLSHSDSFPRLECDATVHYAIGDYFGEISELTAEHLATDSPYNTRLYSGMPPGPISNPGINSLNAVLYPNESDYYYYIFDPEAGTHRFAKTLAEHEQNAKELGY